MRKKLSDAQAEKQEVDFITSKADSVDRTIIEALKREGEEQKEKVKSVTLQKSIVKLEVLYIYQKTDAEVIVKFFISISR